VLGHCGILHVMCARVGVSVILCFYCGTVLPLLMVVRSHIFHSYDTGPTLNSQRRGWHMVDSGTGYMLFTPANV